MMRGTTTFVCTACKREICKRHSRGSMDVFARMQILGLQGMKKD